MADTDTAARPQNATELTSWLNAAMADSNTPRSSIYKLVMLLEKDGFITYERPERVVELGPEDCHHLVRVLEDAGYRLAKAMGSSEASG